MSPPERDEQRRVLVTGATGAFGAPLCAALAATGLAVDAMARHAPSYPLPDGVRFVAGDVTDADAVDRAVAGVDQVVHLAWVVGVSRDPADAERINFSGTRNVLSAMQRHRTRRLVFSSSVLAYGAEYGHAPYREDDELHPDPVLQYGDHKRIIEAEIAAAGIPAMICRPAAVVGRHVTGQSATIFATPVLLGVQGEDHPWQFVHQDDVVRFLVEAVHDDRTGTVNLAADDTFSLERFGELLGRRVVRVRHGVIRRGIGAAWALRLADVNPAAMETLRAFPVADTTRLRKDYGFECAWTSRDAVVDTRRAVAGLNLLGKLELHRRGAPPLRPVDGRTPVDPEATPAPLPGPVVGAIAEVLGADRADGRLVRSLTSEVAPAVTELSARKAAVGAIWAATETPLVLGCSLGGGDPSPAQIAARLHQRWDLCIDVLALAAGAPAGGDAQTLLLVTATTALEALADAVDARARAAGTTDPWDAGLPVYG